MKMTMNAFFSQNSIFRLDQLLSFKSSQGKVCYKSLPQIPQYYIKKNRLLSIRRGLYAVVPAHLRPDEHFLDPYAVGTTVAADSVISYHSALELHGLSHSHFQQITFKTARKIKPFYFSDYLYQPVSHHDFLDQEYLKYTETTYRQGVKIRLTNLASTIVDVLDRPDLCGGWEEVFKSLDSIALIPYKDVVEYCLMFNSPVLSAKVGFFLEHMDQIGGVEQTLIDLLLEKRLKSPYYIDQSSKKSSRYVKKWNLMIPENFLKRSWEEPQNDY